MISGLINEMVTVLGYFYRIYNLIFFIFIKW